MSRRLLAPLAVAVAALVLGAGCGVSTDETAFRVEDEHVPYGLLDPDAPPGVLSPPTGRQVELCLLRDDRLVRVTRTIDQPAALIDIVQALAEVNDQEAASGLRTSLVAGDEIVSVQRSAGTATVGLAAEASQGLTTDPLATIAQLVCTLTRQPGVGLVRFTVAGVAAEVPRADGTLSVGPLTADDYASLLEPPS